MGRSGRLGRGRDHRARRPLRAVRRRALLCSSATSRERSTRSSRRRPRAAAADRLAEAGDPPRRAGAIAGAFRTARAPARGCRVRARARASQQVRWRSEAHLHAGGPPHALEEAAAGVLNRSDVLPQERRNQTGDRAPARRGGAAAERGARVSRDRQSDQRDRAALGSAGPDPLHERFRPAPVRLRGGGARRPLGARADRAGHGGRRGAISSR